MSRRKAARSLSREENLQGKPPGPGYKGQYDEVDTVEYFQYLTVPECRAIPKGILNRQESGKKTNNTKLNNDRLHSDSAFSINFQKLSGIWNLTRCCSRCIPANFF